jgi:hypothetical protein
VRGEPECLLFITSEADNCKRTYQIFDRIEQLNIDVSVKERKLHIFDSRSEIWKARTSLDGSGIGIAGVSS